MTKPTVCILTSGTGSRLENYTKKKNKALLSLNKKSILSRIFKNFPSNSNFILSIGYKGDQVRDFVKIHHPELNVKFVKIKNYNGSGSGPGLSLFKCKKFLQKPFFFVSCDTIWKKKIFNINKYNWMGSFSSSKINTKNYCNLISKKNTIFKIIDKKKIISNKSTSIFVGLAFIKDYKFFWEGLKPKILKEPQVSLGFNNILKKKNIKKIDIDWEDTGTKKNYEDLILKYEKYNFNKDNQQLFISSERVTKFFSEKKTISNLYKKAISKKNIFPKNIKIKNHFISYDYVDGVTLYNHYNIKTFKLLLKFLENNLWNDKTNKTKDYSKICKNFYLNKTKKRIKIFKSKHPFLDKSGYIYKGSKILKINDIFKEIDWKHIFNGVPNFIHGDLQFDNILLKKNNFTLIDWRPNFGKNLLIGDRYYDLAKLLGGLVINYDLIKKNEFKFKINKNKINLIIPHRDKTNELISFFENYLRNKGFDINKVRIITGLIFLNMAPLHHDPFDKLLFVYGKYFLQKTLNLKNNEN